MIRLEFWMAPLLLCGDGGRMRMRQNAMISLQAPANMGPERNPVKLRAGLWHQTDQSLSLCCATHIPCVL